MKILNSMQWLGILGALSVGGEGQAFAQFFIGTAPTTVVSRQGFSFSTGNRYGVFAAGFHTTTITQIGSGFGGPVWRYPAWGFGPTPFWGANFAPPVIVQPPVVVQPIVVQPVILPVAGLGVPQAVQARPEGEVDIAGAPAPMADPDKFIVIRPREPENLLAGRAVEPPPLIQRMPAREMPQRIGPGPNFNLDPEKAKEFPIAPARAANPNAEADRQIEQGRTAFAEAQYGRAIERYRRAIQIVPGESPAYFELAQSYVAVGKYREAILAIENGMKIRPEWPLARYDIRNLYGKHPERFDEHQKLLRDALDALPTDAGLLFLMGHQLWFDGKREEAKGFFALAIREEKVPTPAGLFLGKP